MENKSGLLLSQETFNDAPPIAEKTMLDGTLLDLTGILIIARANESLLSKRPTWKFLSFMLMSKSKNLTPWLSLFFYPALIPQDRCYNNCFQIFYNHWFTSINWRMLENFFVLLDNYFLVRSSTYFHKNIRITWQIFLPNHLHNY